MGADSWLVCFGAAILLKAVTSAGARASASAGVRALAGAVARAATSKDLAYGDASDTVRARITISASAIAVVTASSARDTAFGFDSISIISLRSSSSTGSRRSWLVACPELVVMMLSFLSPGEQFVLCRVIRSSHTSVSPPATSPQRGHRQRISPLLRHRPASRHSGRQRRNYHAPPLLSPLAATHQDGHQQRIYLLPAF